MAFVSAFSVSQPYALPHAWPRFGRTGTSQFSSAATCFRGRILLKRIPTPSLSTCRPVRVVPKAMFSGGGILGVGPSEVVVILAVGWLLLGPQKLFSLAKDSGKFLGELRRTADEAKETFNEAMELDLMAAELNEQKPIKQNDEKGLLVEDDSDASTGSEVPSGAEQDSLQEEPVVAQSAAEEATAEANAMFLEQLKRVSDPGQKAPSELLDRDLSAVDSEEVEVKRLEKQYLEARQRLEQKRKERELPENADNRSVAEER